MRELPLTIDQIKICDQILKRNNKGDNFNYLISLNYEQTDIQISVRYMFENKLMSVFGIIVLTDLGLKYSKKGIVAFIKRDRLNEFLRSVRFKVALVIFGLLITLFFSILNYCKDDVDSTNNIIDKKQSPPKSADSSINISNAIDKKTVKESSIDTSKIFNNANNEKPK